MEASCKEDQCGDASGLGFRDPSYMGLGRSSCRFCFQGLSSQAFVCSRNYSPKAIPTFGITVTTRTFIPSDYYYCYYSYDYYGYYYYYDYCYFTITTTIIMTITLGFNIPMITTVPVESTSRSKRQVLWRNLDVKGFLLNF